MKKIIQWVRDLFTSNQNKKYVYRLFNGLLKKYNVERDGSNYEQQGRQCTSEAQYNTEVNKVIKPMFANMLTEGISHLEENGKASRAKAEGYNKRKADAEEKLNETNEKGKLYRFQQEIQSIKSVPDSTEHIDFPEVELAQIRKPVIDIFQINSKSIMGGKKDVLADLINQKKISMTSDHTYKSFKEKNQQYGSFIFSNQLPPREEQFKKLFKLCGLLTVGEIGITTPIVMRFVEVPFVTGRIGQGVELLFAIFYAVVISLALAIVLKYLGDALLFRNFWKTILFWLLCTGTFLAMAILFSLGASAGLANIEFWIFTITHKAFALSFFSVLLALANGFVYREASYLRAYFYRQKQISLREAQNNQDKYVTEWKNKAINYEQKAKNEEAKEQKVNQMIADLKIMVGNQESICIARYRSGYEKSLRETVRNNGEAILTMINLLKKKL